MGRSSSSWTVLESETKYLPVAAALSPMDGHRIAGKACRVRLARGREISRKVGILARDLCEKLEMTAKILAKGRRRRGRCEGRRAQSSGWRRSGRQRGWRWEAAERGGDDLANTNRRPANVPKVTGR